MGTKRPYGWTGTLLDIDLTAGSCIKTDSSDIAAEFIGGRALAARLYWDLVPAGCGALDPENVLMLLPGPLSGTAAVACSRWLLAAKSPYIYPEQFGFGNAGGFLGAALKLAGYDGIILKGKARGLSYLYVEDSAVSIQGAEGLRGLRIDETMQKLREKHGSNARIVCTGPAGESMVRFATAGTDQGGSLANGMGAVMGSKNLKAIVVKGSGHVAVAEPEKLQAINKRIRTMRKGQNEVLYTSEPMLKGIERGRNAPCYACPAGCTRAVFKHVSGIEQVLQMCASSHYYNAWDQLYYGEASENPFIAIALCNQYGLCTGETANLIWWLHACFKEGLLTEEQTGLPLSRIGSIEFIRSLIESTARKKDFGEMLARGTRRASVALGTTAEAIALRRVTPHGYVDDSYGPRIFLANAIFYATEARNPIIQLHEFSFIVLKWIFWHTTAGMMASLNTDMLRKIARRAWGTEKAVDFTTYAGKTQAAFKIQNGNHAKESMVACDRFYPLLDSDKTEDGLGDPGIVPELFTAVTGQRMDESSYFRFGERAVNLQRAIAMREGKRGRIDDVLNEFHFTEPIEKEEGLIGLFNPDLELPGPGDAIVSIKGRTLDRKAFEDMKSEYYRLRGWDVESGLQRKDTLENLGLLFAAPELEKRGLLK